MIIPIQRYGLASLRQRFPDDADTVVWRGAGLSLGKALLWSIKVHDGCRPTLGYVGQGSRQETTHPSVLDTPLPYDYVGSACPEMRTRWAAFLEDGNFVEELAERMG